MENLEIMKVELKGITRINKTALRHTIISSLRNSDTPNIEIATPRPDSHRVALPRLL